MNHIDNYLYPITQNIAIFLGYPFLFIKDIDAVVAADVHLGIEAIMAEDGAYIPQKKTAEIIRDFKYVLTILKPSSLILLGDVKHSYSEPTKIENKEVDSFLREIQNYVEKIEIVRGNHDIFLNWVTNKIENVSVHDDLKIEKYYFTHGHKPLPVLPEEIEYVFIGHEHPIFKYRVNNLQLIKAPVFLVGPIINSNAKLIVLPAFSPYSLGVAVSPDNQSSLLSPILQTQVDLSKFESYVLGDNNTIFHFPEFESWYH